MRKLKLLIVWMVFACAGCKEPVIHDLTELDANRVFTRFNEASIIAEKVKQADSRWSIAVERKDFVRAIKFLSEGRLLKDEPPAEPKNSSLLLDREEQKFAMERRISRELEKTLGSFEGVVESHVHLNLPPVDSFLGRPNSSQTGSGSVVLLITEGTTLDETALAKLIAGGSGIPISNVSVLINSAPREDSRIPAPIAESLPGGDVKALFSGNEVVTAGILISAVLFAFMWTQRRRNKELLAFKPGVQGGPC
jgi:type III secretory pathway lipoprotein EscJ